MIEAVLHELIEHEAARERQILIGPENFRKTVFELVHKSKIECGCATAKEGIRSDVVVVGGGCKRVLQILLEKFVERVAS